MMKENSRIRFNPFTKEIEIEGSETFVKTYFDKLQSIISGAPGAAAEGHKPAKARAAKKVKEEPEAAKAAPAGKRRTKSGRAAKAETGGERITHIDRVVGLIQGSAEGISTTELKEKTGLVESQIWSIVNRAAKMGKIKKIKRGLYGAG
jgi:hypothetical protein